MLVAVAASLEDEADLVHANGLVAAHQLGDLVRSADRAAQRSKAVLHDLHPERRLVGLNQVAREALVIAALEELLPHVRAPGLVWRDAVVVGERVAEVVRPVDAALDRRGLVLVTHHGQHHADVRVDREADWDAFLRSDEVVVLTHPLPGVLGLDK